MNIVAFRHTTCDGLGSLAHALERAGLDYRHIDTYREDFSSFDPLMPGLLIVLGGAPGVYQAEQYPFLVDEMIILEKRLAADLPTLGICLGAQMMAKALGSDVYIGKQGPEKGWHSIKVSEAGKETAVRHLDSEHTRMLQWHGDTFDLPQGATLLASSDQYDQQVFSWGKNVLGLQCHVEVTPCILKSWIVNAAGDVHEGKLDVEKVRQDTDDHLETLMTQSEKFFMEWLGHIKKDTANA